MLTDEATTTLTFFCLFFSVGLFLQNVAIMLMSIVPLCFLTLGLSVDRPSDISARRSMSDVGAVVGDVVECKIEVSAKGGLGIVTFVDELPNEFELVEGNNFTAAWKGRGEKNVTISYKVKCAKRGTYSINLKSESRHPFGFKQTLKGEGNEVEITVRPRLFDMRRMRGPSTSTRIPLPAGALARIGSPTMEFRELRQYAWGDPLRFINWKATARSTSRGNPVPIVNEYEREGKKLVWIFLDCSPAMLLGPSISNTFEHAVSAMCSLSHYYLSKGCMVGMCAFGGERIVLIHPDAGNRQYRRILMESLKLEPSRDASMSKMDLLAAVSECRGYLMGRKPLCIILGRFTERTLSSYRDGIRELSKYCAIGRGRTSLILVNVMGYGLATKDLNGKIASGILVAKDKIFAKDLRGLSPFWIHWDPSAESLTSATLRQVVKWRVAGW